MSALSIDVYQLTTLIVHAAEGRLDGRPLGMCFLFRRLPNQRNYVVACGLRSILDFCESLRFSPEELRTIADHPVLGPALKTEPGQKVHEALARLDGFVGDIDALPEGTLAFAGPALDESGQPVLIDGTQLVAYTPLLQVRTDLVTAKLIETPWLSRLNHQSMVASKAARVVTASQEDGIWRSVMEFGQRRTHPEAAVDAAYAAYVAGCRATSNLLATHRFGIPSIGTMDHFAVQAAEQLGLPVTETERRFFLRFCELFPASSTLLVDTYDTFGGIERAVRGTSGRCIGVRIDSGVTVETVRRARALLTELGAPGVYIFVSDGLDEYRVRELSRAGADGFGVGENITCVPDAATGIGAVGKLVLNGYGKLTMKLSRGSGKATLPGMLAAYRLGDRDYLSFADEPPPPGGTPLLQPVWRGRQRVGSLPSLDATRSSLAAQLAALPPNLRALEPAPRGSWPIHLSTRLVETVRQLAAAAMV